MFKLRDYQIEAIESVWAKLLKSNNALVSAMTGIGKTEILIGLINKSLKVFPELKCLFVVNRSGLLIQTEKRIRNALGISVGVFFGKEKSLQNQITVATIQSIHKVPDNYNLIIFDEAHNIDQGSGRYIRFIHECLKKNSRLKLVAVTATPFRSDGYIYGEDKIFDSITYEKGYRWAVENKYLVPMTTKYQVDSFNVRGLKIRMGEYDIKQLESMAMEEIKLNKQIASAMPQLDGRNKVVWACVSINHAELVKEKLIEIGEKVCIVHSKKENNLSYFESGEARHLVFVSIVSEGYDYPPIDAIVLMRPTRSPVLYVQIVGRGLRPFADKKDCLVLDYGRVIETLGHIEEPLIKQSSKSKNVLDIKMKFCPACYEYCHLSASFCPICEHEFNTTKGKFSLKNLTEEPYQEKELWVEITGVNDKYHKTSKGFDARVVTLFLDNVVPSWVSNYFVFPYYVHKYKAFIDNIGEPAKVRKITDEQVSFKPSKRLEVKLVKEGKYYAGREIREHHTKRDTGFFELQKDLLLQS